MMISKDPRSFEIQICSNNVLSKAKKREKRKSAPKIPPTNNSIIHKIEYLSYVSLTQEYGTRPF